MEHTGGNVKERRQYGTVGEKVIWARSKDLEVKSI